MNKYFPLIFVTIFEALIGIWVKLVGDAVPIFTLNFYRVFFAFLSLLIIVPFVDKKFLKLKKWDIKSTIFIGFLIALQISLFNIAMKLAPIANVVILWSVYPFFVFIFSWIFLDEKVKKTHILILILGLIGVIITRPFSGLTEHILGNSISLFGGLVFGALITYMRKEDKTNSTGIVFWFFLFSTLFLLPMVFIFGPGNLFEFQERILFNTIFNVPIILWVLGLGIISTGITYLLMTFALQKISANVYSLIDILASPIAAIIFAFIILNEIPSYNMVFGGAVLLISALWLAIYLSKGSITSLETHYQYFGKIRSEFTKASYLHWPLNHHKTWNQIGEFLRGD